MPTTNKIYGQFYVSAFNKELDLDSDTLKVMLCTSAYTPNQDTHRYKSSVTNEVSSSGTGYPAGGYTVTGSAVTYDAASNTVKFDANDVAMTGIDIPDFRYAVLYDSTPATDATRPLILYVDFGAAIAFTGDLTLQWNAVNGAFITTVA